jgi:hypothetical protein
MKKILPAFLISSLLTLTVLFSDNANAKPEIAAKGDGAYGWWLLHEYHDRIQNNRAIGAFSFDPPAWEAVMLKIETDSIYTAGTIIPMKISARLAGDTFYRSNHFTDLRFAYNKKKKEVTVTFHATDGTVQTFHYRQFRSNELVTLGRNMFDVNHRFALQENYHTWFVQQMIAGRYRSISDNSTMNLTPEETVTGFEKWNQYHLDVFFGTTHWTGKLDRIRFEDSTKTGAIKDYNWRWSHDTLILRPFVGQSIETYKLGATETKFVRIPPAEK